MRVQARHLSHKEYNEDQDRWLLAHIAWDMSTAVHPQSPTLSTDRPYEGPMCQHELVALDTLSGRDWRFDVQDAATA